MQAEDVNSTQFQGSAAAGTVIGPYHLLELIGTGGMGEVWLAEQKTPLRRRVALKLIKPGMDTREVIARFESERQALALMDHPAIAKVFDAGSTPQGRPYFVMEYVRGMAITEYCDKHRLSTSERLDLFIQVCEGVQHAHQKAILHRDLKPSNILVGEVDGKAAPKIIDFGVAKAMAQGLTKETMFTSAGAILGTPDYMSPEQADSAGLDIDTRTDVYSLGVVLYELLVGALPLDFRNLPFDQILRMLREEDAPRPSTKVRTAGQQSTTAAENRRTDVRALARQLRGDLDAITLKAVEKDRSRRYGTPSELSADIGRYLRNEPVLAHPPSVAYRARKYIRRHRLGVAIAAAAVVLLTSFAIAQAFELRRITRERDRADRITKFMISMFNVSNPSEAHGNQVTARQILDKASKDIGTGLARDPELQAQMMHVMGTVYWELGLYPQSESLFSRALEIRRRVLGPKHPDTLKSMHNLATVLTDEGHDKEAEALFRETLETRRRILGREHPDTLSTMNNLAGILDDHGHVAEAEGLFREVFEGLRRTLGPEHPRTLVAMDNMTRVLAKEGHYAEAEKQFRLELQIERRVLGPDHPDTLSSMRSFANFLIQQGRYLDGQSVLREALSIQQRVLGPEHRDTLGSMGDLARVLMHTGQDEEADRQLRAVREIQRRILGWDHPDTAGTTYALACVAAHSHRPQQAILLLREALDHGLRQSDAAIMEKDPDLNSLHSDPRFAALVAYAHQRAAAATKAK